MSNVALCAVADISLHMRIQLAPAFVRLRRATAPLWLLAPCLLALGGCDLVVLNPTGFIALQQRNLILIATGLMLLIIVPVMVMTVLFAWRYRKGGGATYDPNFDHSTQLELVIWACPLLIIICLGAVTWSSTHLLDPFRPLERIDANRPVPPGTQPLEVQVVAMDWKWLFILPAQGIAAVNELALPVDVPVRFSITSTSQMNTFYAPTLAGMIYAMPGMQSALHAVLNHPGDTWGFSANYTGRGFSDMRFRLRGMDKAGFDQWVAGIKADGGSLTRDTYLAMEHPSEKEPVAHFGAVAPGLFDRVVNRCVQPGRPCASDVMRHDQQHGGGHMDHMHQVRPGTGMPSAHESMPPAGGKPVPALQKAPEDKGTGPNVTSPPATDEPGPQAPGDQRNRDHSALTLPIRGLS